MSAGRQRVDHARLGRPARVPAGLFRAVDAGHRARCARRDADLARRPGWSCTRYRPCTRRSLPSRCTPCSCRSWCRRTCWLPCRCRSSRPSSRTSCRPCTRARVARAGAARRARAADPRSRCRPCSCRSWCRRPCCCHRCTSSRPSCRTSCRSCSGSGWSCSALPAVQATANPRAVADHVRAAAGAGRLVAGVDARHRARRARRRAVLASRARVRRAVVAGRAGDARARAVADHVGAAGGAGRLVAAVDARHRARRARRRAVPAAGSGSSCTSSGRAGAADARAVAHHVRAAAGAGRLVGCR